MLPGSPELMQANVETLRTHRVALWAKHGVMARSDASVKRASDRIEYAETGARYEYLNLTDHGLADGLNSEEIRAICGAFGIRQEDWVPEALRRRVFRRAPDLPGSLS